jgi:hypothetical protein
MKPRAKFLIEPVAPDPGVFTLTSLVAYIRRPGRKGEIVGTIHRSFRNAPGVTPGLPTWWFCPDLPATPVERSDDSEADIVAKALAWVQRHRQIKLTEKRTRGGKEQRHQAKPTPRPSKTTPFRSRQNGPKGRRAQ